MVSTLLDYEGKRALVVGGATGMGAATARLAAELGAAVTVMDVAPVRFAVDRVVSIDLRDRTSVESACDAVDAPFDAVFSCAGVAQGRPGLLEVNFVGQRHLIETLVAAGAVTPGGAIGVISSMAGLGWYLHTDVLLPFLATQGWEEASDWVAVHDIEVTYRFTKQAMSAYVAQRAMGLLDRDIRLNCVEPSTTDTPLARAEDWFGFGTDYRRAAGLEPLTPEQVAYPLLYLCSPAAGGVAGTSIRIDQGLAGAALTGAFDTPGTRERFGLDPLISTSS